MHILSKLYTGFKLMIIVSVLVGAGGFAFYSYIYMDSAFDQAQDEREQGMSDVKKQYTMNASCEATKCEYTLISGDKSSEIKTIQTNSTETITFDEKEFKIKATSTNIQAVTDDENGEQVVVVNKRH